MTVISKYINENGDINIPQEEWEQIKGDQAEIISAFQQEIAEGNLRFPTREITLDDVEKEFRKLEQYRPKGWQYGNLTTRYEYQYPLGNKYISDGRVGSDASNYFHQQARFTVDSYTNPSAMKTWQKQDLVVGLVKCFYTMKYKSITMGNIRSALALRKYVASQFKPAVAKFIYEQYNAKDILDFSAGWGDRLLAFYCTEGTRSYIGIDPNDKVYEQYYKQAELYESYTNKNRQVKFYNLPAEEVVLEDMVDTVFTSPPYFNAEHYSNDDTQSWVRYKSIDRWLDGFLFPALTMAWKSLKPNGHLILNIADVHSRVKHHETIKICDPMNDFIKGLGGEFQEAVGMKMTRRVNSTFLRDKEGIVVEPIWVWKKTT